MREGGGSAPGGRRELAAGRAFGGPAAPLRFEEEERRHLCSDGAPGPLSAASLLSSSRESNLPTQPAAAPTLLRHQGSRLQQGTAQLCLFLPSLDTFLPFCLASCSLTFDPLAPGPHNVSFLSSSLLYAHHLITLSSRAFLSDVPLITSAARLPG